MKRNSHEKGVSYGPHRGVGLYTPDYSYLLVNWLSYDVCHGVTHPRSGLLMCMFAMMGVISLAMYDEQGEWRRYRLALPVSRRSVVLARYGVGSDAYVGWSGSRSWTRRYLVAIRNGGTGAFRIHDRNARRGYGHAYVRCNRGYRGTFVIAFVVPMAFKWESVRAVSLISLVLVLVVGLAKHVADQLLSEHMQLFISSFRPWTMQLQNYAIFIGLVVIIAAIILAISAILSLRIYSNRDL